MSHANSTRAIFFALGANITIAASKGVAAFLSGSAAMLAETVHSLADCGNQGLLLVGMRQAKAPATADHPLGSGKAIYFWSFLVAVMLFSLGGMFSLYEGFHKLSHPEPLRQWWWAAGVLVFSIVAEGISMRACLQEVNKARGERPLWHWFRESRQAELLVIFGEDLAALLGLTLALAAVMLSVVTGNPLWDAVGTLMIGALLIAVAIYVAIEVKSMLIGESMDPATAAEMRRYIESQPQVVRVFNLITLQLGDDVMVAVKACMSPTESPLQLVDAINAVEASFRQRFPQVRWSFFEPDHSD
ncbi:MAG: cation diffusion facilitator family transporter [Steroidobacteraceae bacterium]